MTLRLPARAPPAESPCVAGPDARAAPTPPAIEARAASPPWLPVFCAVFRENYAYIARFLRHLGLRERDIDDVAQEVFVVVFQRFHLYDTSRPALPWICAFAVHCARAHRRRAARAPDADAGRGDATDSIEGGAPLDETIGARRSIRRGLAALPDEQREVFVLHDLLGFTVPEIAEIVGILTNTAYSRLRLARATFVLAVRPGGESSDV
jgi:RNA polymerase sigma-70 factor (ECF subfamily)